MMENFARMLGFWITTGTVWYVVFWLVGVI